MMSTGKALEAGATLRKRMARPSGGYAPIVGMPQLLPVLALAFAAAASYALGSWWDNDINYIIALGRSIIADGLPWTDPLTCNEGLDCIAQQWLFCVACALLYDNGGEAAVSALVLALWCAAAACTYKACRAAGASERLASAATAAALAVCIPFVKTNPRAIDVCALMACVWAVSRFLDGSGRALLVPIAVSAAMANLHCTMWPVAAIPLVAAMADGRADGRRRMVVACLAATCAASAASPYGIWSSLYVFMSMGPGLAALGIGELEPPQFGFSNIYFDAFLLAVLAYVLVRARRGGRLGYADALMAIMSAMMFSQVRNGLLFLPVSASAFCGLLKDRAAGAPCVGAALARFGACALLAVGSAGLLLAAEPESLWHGESRDAVLAAFADAGVEPGDAVLNSFGTGGWLELAGLRPAYDERAELFLPQVNGGQDLASDMVRISRKYPSELLARVEPEKYAACVLQTEEAPYYEAVMPQAGYTLVFADESLTAWARER